MLTFLRRRWVRRVLGALFVLAFVVGVALVLLLMAEALAPRFYPRPALLDAPISGSPDTVIEIDWHDFHYTIRTNSKGLRNEEVPPETEHDYRIVAIGDSYTFGWGVELEETWGKQLQALLRARGLDVEVVNVGQPGVGPPDYTMNVRRAANDLNPDLFLIALLQGNDLNQCWVPWHELYFPNLMQLSRHLAGYTGQGTAWGYTMNAEQHQEQTRGYAQNTLQQMSAEARERFEMLDDEVKQLFLDGRINPWMIGECCNSPNVLETAANLDTGFARFNIKAMRIFLEHMRNAAARVDARVMALSVPNGFYDNEPMYHRLERLGYILDPNMLGFKGADEAVRGAAERAGVPFFSAMDAFLAHRDDPGIYYDIDHHWRPAGHRLFAQAIVDAVEKEVRADLAQRN